MSGSWAPPAGDVVVGPAPGGVTPSAWSPPESDPVVEAPPPIRAKGVNLTPEEQEQVKTSVPASFGQGVASGVVKSVGGTVQTLADILHLGNLGKNIGQYTDLVSQKVLDPANAQSDSAASGQMVGQIAPFLFGGEVLTGLKGWKAATAGLGFGEATEGDEEESGETTEDRNSARLSSMEEALLPNLVFGGGSALAGRFVRQVANSHAIDKPLKKIFDMVASWEPDVSPAAREITPQIQQMAKRFSAGTSLVNALVKNAGGVDTAGVVPAVEEAKKLLPQITADDVSKKTLQGVVNALDEIVAPKGADFDKVAKALGRDPRDPAMAKVVQSFEQQGMDILPKSPAEFSTIAQLSEQIGDHLNSLGTEARREGGQALAKIQTSLDLAMKNALVRTPPAARGWSLLKKNYVDALRPLNDFGKTLLSPDPRVQMETLNGIIHTSDIEAARVLAPMMSDAGKESFLQLAIKQAVARSISPVNGQINAGKFARFFDDPGRKDMLELFRTSKWDTTFEGMKNLVKHDATAVGNARLFGPNAGVLGTAWGSYSAMKGAVDKLAEGAPVAAMGHLTKLMLTWAALRGIYKATDALTSTLVGRNFLHATKDLTPSTPEMAKTIERWRPRITRAMQAFVGTQTAGGQQPPGQIPPQ